MLHHEDFVAQRLIAIWWLYRSPQGLGILNKNVWSELGTPLVDSGDVADHPYQQQFEEFFKALRKGKKMAYTNLDEAAKSHQLIFAADESAATGKPVKIR